MKYVVPIFLILIMVLPVLTASAAEKRAEKKATYSLTARGKPGGGGGGTTPGDGVVNKFAVVVGISDYKNINDLTYCDEDANDWKSFLQSKGYSIRSCMINNQATEYAIRAALAGMFAVADGDDIVCFASSGHGSSGSGHQVIIAYDYGSGVNGYDGLIWDVELDTIFNACKAKHWIFLDHCMSGGMKEAVAGVTYAYMTTTCSASGYGYDMPEYNNGAWTYWFLEQALVGQHFTALEDAFAWGVARYPFGGKDLPCQFDGSSAKFLY
jgi:hypothetical protein